MSNNIALQVNHLSKSYYIPSKKQNTLVELLSDPFSIFRHVRSPVVEDVSFEVGKGEAVGIIGRNGTGKSTLLKTIAGVYAPEKGTVEVQGRLVPFLELGVGFHPELTARENIYLNGIILGMSRSAIRSNFDRILDFAELAEYVNLPLKNFSSGMQVRLAFSIAFLSDADIYLLDEVFAVGDIAFQQKCFAVFNELKKKGKTLVLVSHSMDMVNQFCDRAILLHNHRIYADGEPNQVIATYKSLLGM